MAGPPGRNALSCGRSSLQSAIVGSPEAIALWRALPQLKIALWRALPQLEIALWRALLRGQVSADQR
jgi:hypothetical protein